MIDPTIMYRERIKELEIERDKLPDISNQRVRINDSIKYYEQQIRYVERIKKMGAKF